MTATASQAPHVFFMALANTRLYIIAHNRDYQSYTARPQHNQTSALQASPQCRAHARCSHPPLPRQNVQRLRTGFRKMRAQTVKDCTATLTLSWKILSPNMTATSLSQHHHRAKRGAFHQIQEESKKGRRHFTFTSLERL